MSLWLLQMERTGVEVMQSSGRKAQAGLPVVAEPLKQPLLAKVCTGSMRPQEHTLQPHSHLCPQRKNVTRRQRRGDRGHWTNEIFSERTANSRANPGTYTAWSLQNSQWAGSDDLYLLLPSFYWSFCCSYSVSTPTTVYQGYTWQARVLVYVADSHFLWRKVLCFI